MPGSIACCATSSHVEVRLPRRLRARVAAVVPRPASMSGERRVDVDVELQRYLRGTLRRRPDVVGRSGSRGTRRPLEAHRPGVTGAGGPLPAELVLRLDTGRGVGTSVAEEFPLLVAGGKAGICRCPIRSGSKTRAIPSASAHRLPPHAGRGRRRPDGGRVSQGAGDRARAGAGAGPGPRRGGAADRGSAGARIVGAAHPRTALALSDCWRSKKPFPSLVIEAAFIWLFGKHRRRTGPFDRRARGHGVSQSAPRR